MDTACLKVSGFGKSGMKLPFAKKSKRRYWAFLVSEEGILVSGGGEDSISLRCFN